MKILHLNTFDRQGGAAIAAHRVHTGLRELDVHSCMGVLYKSMDDPSCFPMLCNISLMLHPFVRHLDNFLLRFYKRPAQANLFSPLQVPMPIHRQVWRQQADIVHLHWLCFSFVPLFSLKRLPGPIVWTTHDCWAFTGGCHFPGNCTRFEEQCGKCPELGSRRERDLSRLGWLRKRKIYSQIHPVIVSPSAQFADTVRRSSLLREARVEFIPNPVDTDLFRPIPHDVARQALNLPLKGRIILFGALSATSDHRKGYDLLRDALYHLDAAAHEDVNCLIFGASKGNQGDELPFPVRFLGHLHDETSLALAYAAADVFVCPSREESFSNTTVEALACGTPVVAFPVGGIPDMVRHKENGYLAQPFDAKELAQGITWVLETSKNSSTLRESARRLTAQRYSLTAVAQKYLALYQELVGEMLPSVAATGVDLCRKDRTATFEILRLGTDERLQHPQEIVADSLDAVHHLQAVAGESCKALEACIQKNAVACPLERRGEGIAGLSIEGRWRDGPPVAHGQSNRSCPSHPLTQTSSPMLSPGRRLLKTVLQHVGLFETAKRCRAWLRGRDRSAAVAGPVTGVYCGHGPAPTTVKLGNVVTTLTYGLVRAPKGCPANDPARRTFASWLTSNPMGAITHDAVFAFEASREMESHVALLRGLLSPEQRIVVLNGSNPSIFANWGKTERFADGSIMYSGPPEAWLHGRQWLREGRDWPRITIVMPSFNQCQFVRQALESVFSQGYPNLETIVLDAGSTDGTRDVLREYESQITHLILEPDKGQSDALQKGFNLSTGTYLTWLNTDDLLEPDALFRAMEAFKRFQVDMVTGGCRVVSEAGEELDRHFPALPFGRPVPLETARIMDFLGSWSRGDFFYQPEVFFTREIWSKAGGFFHPEAYYSMDYDLWVRMALAGARAILLPHFLAASRHQQNQKTNLDGSEAPYLWQTLNFMRHYQNILGILVTTK